MTSDRNVLKMNQTESEIFRIRVRKEDSAFVYAVFEASEGVAAYSTLPHREGDHYRDLELIVPLSQKLELMRILQDLKEELHGQLEFLSVDESSGSVRNP